MSTTPKRVATYRRVSTEEQVSNHSLGNQADKLAAFADQQGYAVVREYVDPGHSGTKRERPGLNQLLEDAKAGLFDTVLIYRLDRLARSTHLAYTLIQELMDAGVGLRSYSEPQIDSTTPMGKVSLGVTAIFAELERDTFLQRSKDGHRKALHSGLYSGGVIAYGYEVKDHRFSVHAEEGAVVRMIFAWCVERQWSNVRIADELNRLKIPTRYRALNRRIRGEETMGYWRAGVVYRILTNRKYMGEYVFGRRNRKGKNDLQNVITVPAPAIVTPEVWEAAQAVQVTNRLTAMRNAKHTYMLKSLIRCAACGRSYVGAQANNRAAYRCGGRVIRASGPRELACKNPHLRGDVLEAQIWGRIREILSAPEVALAQQPLSIVPAELPLVERALEDARKGRVRLTDLYLDVHGGMSKEEYLARLAALDVQQAELEARASALRDTEVQRRQQRHLEDKIHDLAAQYRDGLDGADDVMKQTLAHQLVRRITVQADGSVDVDWVV